MGCSREGIVHARGDKVTDAPSVGHISVRGSVAVLLVSEDSCQEYGSGDRGEGSMDGDSWTYS